MQNPDSIVSSETSAFRPANRLPVALCLVAVTIGAIGHASSWSSIGAVIVLVWLELVSLAVICLIEWAAKRIGPFSPLPGRMWIPLPLLMFLLGFPLTASRNQEDQSLADFLCWVAVAIGAALPFRMPGGFRPGYVVLVWTAYGFWTIFGFGMFAFCVGGMRLIDG